MPKLYYKSGSSWVNALNIFYPVGAFYISNVSTSPATLLGGTWAQVTNAAIRGATKAGYTGSDTHTLTVNEMPSHQHTADVYLIYQEQAGGTGYFAYGTRSAPQGNLRTYAAGGGGHIPTFSALTTATFGIALPKRGWR